MAVHQREGGQASVELVALLPLATLVALAIGQLLAAGSARELAGNAAEAGAAALLQGSDPTAAARAPLPGGARGRRAGRGAGGVAGAHDGARGGAAGRGPRAPADGRPAARRATGGIRDGRRRSA